MVTSDSATSPTDDIEPELLRFIQNTANSFVKWDLIRFFHDNPHAVDAPEQLARFISRDVNEIEDELEALLAQNVLRLRVISNVKLYSLTPEPVIRAVVSRFLHACDDRIFRAKAIRVVIDNLP